MPVPIKSQGFIGVITYIYCHSIVKNIRTKNHDQADDPQCWLRNEAFVNGNRRAAIKEFKEAGWKYSRKYGWLCPHCAIMLEEDKPKDCNLEL